MTPPANAVVFSVDEKSQVQALQRAQPILPMDVGQPERCKHNYVRHGTHDLFVALFMRPRCVELARVLKKTKSFYYHCDWHASHYVKVMLCT